MAKSSGQKLKLLYLIKMLQENTDENHPMSTPDIIKYLENQGIHAERKSIYSDMESLAVTMWYRCRAGWEAVITSAVESLNSRN